MTSVFRFEGKNGEGPFMKEAYLEWCELDIKDMPSVVSDFEKEDSFNVYPGSPWLFGCLNKEDLNLWFKPEVKRKLTECELKFSIKEYKVENLIISKSGKQVMFKTVNNYAGKIPILNQA